MPLRQEIAAGRVTGIASYDALLPIWASCGHPTTLGLNLLLLVMPSAASCNSSFLPFLPDSSPVP